MGRRHRKSKGRGRSSGSSSSSDSGAKYHRCGCKRKDGRRNPKERTRKADLARKMPRGPDGKFKSKWADSDYNQLRAAAVAATGTTTQIRNPAMHQQRVPPVQNFTESTASSQLSTLSSSSSSESETNVIQTLQAQQVPQQRSETTESSISPTSSGSRNENPAVQIPQLPEGLPPGISEMIAQLIAQAMKEVKDGGTAVNGAES